MLHIIITSFLSLVSLIFFLGGKRLCEVFFLSLCLLHCYNKQKGSFGAVLSTQCVKSHRHQKSRGLLCCSSAATGDTSQEKFLYLKGHECDFILPALGQHYAVGNWVYRQQLGPRS